ncbi:hypothetical protein CERZMDRAFT_100291 [Cercospora zeae-maydis SCOH1-5]|uniref:BTB domain-containing protein n=1 Tax=Cercospora zeae-maydis SCOH1-5 TaxID=717836 RepID=A0A6A6F4W8_9PEZI|nr:hypothetical protein CERZMDRAFT_100291 [Cercospora zeae-maydis SCOH1-5]
MCEASPKKRRRFGDDIIALKVGKDDHVETFGIHAALLEERGGFFEAALNKQWKEGRERKIELPDDDAETVAIYVEWLHTKHMRPHTEKERDQWDSDDVEKEYEQLARLYIFGEKVHDDEICNRCIDAILNSMDLEVPASGDTGDSVDFSFYYPSHGVVKTIFQNTHATSPIRRLCVDIYSLFSEDMWFEVGGEGSKDVDHLLECPDFLLALVKQNVARRDNPKVGESWFKSGQYYK